MQDERLFFPALAPWGDVKAFHFFLFPSGASGTEWGLTKTLNDLQKRLFALGNLTYARVDGAAVKVSLALCANAGAGDILAGIQSVFPYTIQVLLPPYLLGDRQRLLADLSKISAWNAARIETSETQREIRVRISGTDKQVFRSRIDIYKAIERMQGNETALSAAHIDAPAHIENGVHVYFDSKILSNRVLLAGSNLLTLKEKMGKDEKVHKHTMRIDPLKLAYCTTYTRSALEDILVVNDAYIEEIVEKNKGESHIVITSLSERDLFDAVSQLYLFFASIVRLKIQEVSSHCAAKVFILEARSGFVALGEIAEIKKLLQCTDLPCVLVMDISASIEEFICGKKNGKINKVAKESLCTVQIKKEPSPQDISLVIQGTARNVDFALGLVEDELPAEYAFYLHEKHHKRIIGYGGKSIQRLMKRHGVYIKFDNGARKKNNVVIRTPKKNKDSLHRMYKEVMELAGEVPELILGVWSSISLLDFYAVPFQTYRIKSDTAEVFSTEPADVKYYLLNPDAETSQKPICSVGGQEVIASAQPLNSHTSITTDLWRKETAFGQYFLSDHAASLFTDDAIWRNPWSSAPRWGRGFSRME